MAEWISVKDRLPGVSNMVLCYMPISYNGYGGIHYGWLSASVTRPGETVWKAHSPHAYAHDMEDELYTGTKGSKVTYWQPLPPPPEEP